MSFGLEFAIGVINEIESTPHIFVRDDQSSAPFLFERSAVVKRVAAKTICSNEDLVVQDCPNLSEVYAERDLVVINCPPNIKLRAGRDIHYIYIFSGRPHPVKLNFTCGRDMNYYPIAPQGTLGHPVVIMENQQVHGDVVFFGGGKLILQGSSEITGEVRNATVVQDNITK